MLQLNVYVEHYVAALCYIAQMEHLCIDFVSSRQISRLKFSQVLTG